MVNLLPSFFSTWTASVLVTFILPLSAFDKLGSQYQIAYGDPKAPIHITEYFSLSCSECLETFKNDFSHLKKRYIDTQKVYWVFHPNPADLLTLQALVCLRKLSPEEKRVFWNVILNSLDDLEDISLEGPAAMQFAMESFQKPVHNLADLENLKTTESFKDAYQYLKQSDIVTEIPTVEINQKLFDEYPSRKFLDQQLSSLLTQRPSL